MEGNPKNFAKLEGKNRNSTLFNGCLSTEARPQDVSFNVAMQVGGIAVEGGFPTSEQRMVCKIEAQSEYAHAACALFAH